MQKSKSPYEERKEKKLLARQRFERFRKYWLVYLGLGGTAILSSLSGVLLAHAPDPNTGVVSITPITIGASLFYLVGFLTTGEGAAYFWFDKLTDHDEDNTWQLVIAWLMLAVSVITVLVTSLAAGSFIAFWMGKLSAFRIMPIWAQEWVVWAIPALWVAHFVAGTIFRAISDEAKAERRALRVIREVQMEMRIEAARARAERVRREGPRVARQVGESLAEHDLQGILARQAGARVSSPPPPPTVPVNGDNHREAMEVNPTLRR